MKSGLAVFIFKEVEAFEQVHKSRYYRTGTGK